MGWERGSPARFLSASQKCSAVAQSRVDCDKSISSSLLIESARLQKSSYGIVAEAEIAYFISTVFDTGEASVCRKDYFRKTSAAAGTILTDLESVTRVCGRRYGAPSHLSGGRCADGATPTKTEPCCASGDDGGSLYPAWGRRSDAGKTFVALLRRSRRGRSRSMED